MIYFSRGVYHNYRDMTEQFGLCGIVSWLVSFQSTLGSFQSHLVHIYHYWYVQTVVDIEFGRRRKVQDDALHPGENVKTHFELHLIQ